MIKQIKVLKRNGERELLNYDKINNVLLWATENYKNVNASDVAMNAKLQFRDDITTEEIHKVLIQSACNLITEDQPNYQYVASNLANYLLRKQVFSAQDNLPSIYEVAKMNIKRGIYDKLILEKYSEEDFSKINKFIKHQRDFNFSYAGIQQVMDKYLLRDRVTGQIFETPQYMYMMISMTIFMDYDPEKRLKFVKNYYDDISLFKTNLPTPIMSGVRTPNRQYSSCTLIDVGDDLDSIFNSNSAVGYYTAKRAGIGLNFGRIRASGDKIRGGEVVHTGVVPFLKMFEATTKSCTQNGVRGGSSTTHFPFWHKEIMDILVLKNNKGTDDNRVRKMDYSIQFNRIFYKRFVEDKELTLFSPGDVPDLYEAFFKTNEEFEALYEKYENDKKIKSKKVKARDLMTSFVQERIGTGRMYVMNVDHVNSHSSFLESVKMSNLCLDGNTNIDIIVENLDDPSLIDGFGLEKIDNIYQGIVTLKEADDIFKKLYIESYNIDNNVVLRSRGLMSVKSKNIELNENQYKPIFGSSLIKKDANVLKITDENTKKYIICTEEHKVWTKNRGYVLAKDLEVTDVLEIN